MKRIKRMVSLDQVTQKLMREAVNPALSNAVLQALPTKVFGKTVGSRIQEVQIRGKKLILRVEDPSWRKELEKQSGMLLEKVREARPYLETVQIIP